MLYPTDGTAFEMLAAFIEHEYVDPEDMEVRGMLAALGIQKGKPFQPDTHTHELLDKAARTASHFGHAVSYDTEPDRAERACGTRTGDGSTCFPATLRLPLIRLIT